MKRPHEIRGQREQFFHIYVLSMQLFSAKLMEIIDKSCFYLINLDFFPKNIVLLCTIHKKNLKTWKKTMDY